MVPEIEESMKIPLSIVTKVVETLLVSGAKTVTKYLDDKTILRASRPTYDGKFGTGNTTIILTIGRPNFAERQFIKLCKKAKEKFPIAKIQLKFPKILKKK